MAQDPYGQPPGTSHIVRGEVVPDDGGNVSPPTTPMTQFQKVASALREDQTDPAIPAYVPSDREASPAGPPSPDPGGTGPGTNQHAATTSPDARDGADEDAARPEDVVAVRSPDAGTREYWDEAGETDPDKAATARSPDEPAATPDEAATAASLDEPAADAATQDPTITQAHAGGPAHAGAPARDGLRPGESGDFSDLTYGSLLPDAAEFKAQWQQVQFRFVDDPQGSVTEAADVVAQVTGKLEAAIAERQRALRGRWSEGKSTDTESLRETLLMYRAFLDQLTGPKAS